MIFPGEHDWYGDGLYQPMQPLLRRQLIQEPDCEFRTRLAPTGQSDMWWEYGTTELESRQAAVSICRLYQDVGASYFQRFASFPNDFVGVTPAMLISDGPLPFPRGCTFVRLALALARVSQRVGRATDAREFAEIGLARIGPAVALKHAFKEIIAAT